MSQFSDDLVPRPAPNPTENKGLMIIPSVPDVSIVFDHINKPNIITTQPQCLNSNNLQRKVFNHLNYDLNRIDNMSMIMKTIPTIFNKDDYKQPYYNLQCNIDNQQSTTIPANNAPFIHIQSTPQLTSPNPPTSNSVITQSEANNFNSIKTDLQEIMEILKQNSEEIKNLKKENETYRNRNDQLLKELRDCKTTINEILDKQINTEIKMNEIEVQIKENFSQTKEKTCVHHNDYEKENLVLPFTKPKPLNNNRIIQNNNNMGKFVINDNKKTPVLVFQTPLITTTTTPQQLQINSNNDCNNNNQEIKQLLHKYEISNVTPRRAIDFSVSSLNYLQRHGLLEENH